MSQSYTAKARRERYAFDRSTDPWGTRTIKTWETDVIFTVEEPALAGEDHTFGIEEGGVTGYERVFLTEEFVKGSCEHGWWACAGTPERWDGLFIAADQMRQAFDALGILGRMGLR